MNSIERDIDIIKDCLFQGHAISEDGFWNDRASGLNTAWKEYNQCRHTSHLVMQYDFDSPMELKGLFKRLYRDNQEMSDDLMNVLLVGIFRQKKLVQTEVVEEATDIPTYIYNF